MNRKHFFAACVALSSLVCAGPITAEESGVAPPPVVAPLAVEVVGEEVAGFQLSVRTDKPKYQAGEPITLIARLENVTKEDLRSASYGRVAMLRLSAVEVILPDGQKAPLTLLGKKNFVPLFQEIYLQNPLGRVGRRGSTLASKEALKTTFQINRLYDMSLPGEYKIVATQQVARKNNYFWILPVSSEPIPPNGFPLSSTPLLSSYVPLSSNTISVTVEDTPSITLG